MRVARAWAESQKKARINAQTVWYIEDKHFGVITFLLEYVHHISGDQRKVCTMTSEDHSPIPHRRADTFLCRSSMDHKCSMREEDKWWRHSMALFEETRNTNVTKTSGKKSLNLQNKNQYKQCISWWLRRKDKTKIEDQCAQEGGGERERWRLLAVMILADSFNTSGLFPPAVHFSIKSPKLSSEQYRTKNENMQQRGWRSHADPWTIFGRAFRQRLTGAAFSNSNSISSKKDIVSKQFPRMRDTHVYS